MDTIALLIAVGFAFLGGYFFGRSHECFRRAKFNRELLTELNATLREAEKVTQAVCDLAGTRP